MDQGAALELPTRLVDNSSVPINGLPPVRIQGVRPVLMADHQGNFPVVGPKQRQQMSQQEEQEDGPVTTLGPQVQRPRRYKVFLHNDDYTTMEFVVFVLQKVFLKGHDEAHQIMMKVHQEGVGLCGIYTHEIAESKVARVAQLAKDNGHPLKCSMEAE